ncbi:MAG: lysoplasmalogenase [Bacilli bacterium]|nr:lysoplasmalogenase [Bacilli bacterium]
MLVCIILISLGALALVFYLLEKCKNYSLKGVLLKTVVSLLFIATAIAAAYQNLGHPLHYFVIAGLILGLLGDIWLDLKYVYPKDDKLYTYAGFTVFAIGHILYIIGMMIEFFDQGNWVYFLIPVAVAIVFSVANLLLSKPMKLDFKDMKWIVFAYAFLLALNPATSLILCINTGWSHNTLIMLFVGGVLFAISDLVLSNTYFGENHEKPIDFILNYITYYGAQFIIAFSLMFL